MNILQKQKWVVGSFLLGLFMLLLIGLGAYRVGMANVQSELWVQHTYQVQHELVETLSVVQDIGFASRGYVITGQDSYLDPFNNAVDLIPGNLRRLRELTADNTAQQHNLDLLEPLIQHRIELSNKLIGLRRHQGPLAASEQVVTGEGQQIMEEIRLRISAMQDLEARLLQQRRDALWAHTRRSFMVFLVTVALLVVLLVTAFVLVRRLSSAQQRETELTAKARAYAENIVDTVREPLLVLDSHLHVRSANRSYYQVFRTAAEHIQGKALYQIGEGQWNIPELRSLLETILPKHTQINDFEVEHDFPGLGRRIMNLNARKMFRVGNKTDTILLAIEDVTDSLRAKEALRKSEEQFRRLLNSAAEIPFLVDNVRNTVDDGVATEFTRGFDKRTSAVTLKRTEVTGGASRRVP